MKYIDADLLRKEIEFAKSVYDNPNRVVVGVADAFKQDGRAAMCDDILKKIDSLQQKQPEKPVSADLEEAAKEYCPDDAYPFGPAIINKEVRKAFIAGYNLCREQLLNEAVEAIISQCPGSNEIIFHNPISVHSWEFPWKFSAKGLKKGDKVKLIIVKEGEK